MLYSCTHMATVGFKGFNVYMYDISMYGRRRRDVVATEIRAIV